MSWPGRVLVIGAAGFVGRALCRRLLAAGVTVDGIVRSATSTVERGVAVHEGGLEDAASLRKLVDRCDTVVHLASASTPGASRASPTIEATLNLAPTLRLLEILQDTPEKHLVYMSSGGAVYGSPRTPAATEDEPRRPLSYYGAGKAATEVFLHAFGHAFHRRVTVLRPSNLYGPGQPRYVGFAVVRTMLQHALDGTSMQIWGDGQIVRDYLFIDDLIDAFVAVLTATSPEGVYNVGAGVGHSLRELLAEVERASAKRIAVDFRPQRAIDASQIVLDVGRMSAHFGWRSKINLAQGIETTWRWLLTQQG